MNGRESRFLRACRPPTRRYDARLVHAPGGRYMPEYRALRERHSLLELCRTPELAAQVTLQPVHASRSTPPSSSPTCCCRSHRWACPSISSKAKGPSIDEPIRTRDGHRSASGLRPREELAHVWNHPLVRRELDGRVPLIGFAGAPFTLASYAIEGGPSANFARTKALMYGEPAGVAPLCVKCRDGGRRLSRRADRGGRAGGSGVRLVGGRARSRRDYREFALPHTQAHLRDARAAERAD